MKPHKCGLTEFIANLNSRLIGDKLEFQKNEPIEEKEEIFCRKCGKK